MYEDKKKINTALVSVVIEKALLNVGKATHDKVIEILYKEYHCYIPDCYDHPEYLHEVLQNFFGNASNSIIQSIKEDLEEYEGNEQVRRFLEVISK